MNKQNELIIFSLLGIAFASLVILGQVPSKQVMPPTMHVQSGWTAFTSEKYRIQFQYPSIWNKGQEDVKATQESTIIVSLAYSPSNNVYYAGEGDIAAGVVYYTNIEMPLADWFHQKKEMTQEKQQHIVDGMKQFVNDPKNAIQLKDIETSNRTLTVSGSPAIVQQTVFRKPQYIEGGAYTYKVYYIHRGDTIIAVEAQTPTDEQTENRLHLFDQMVNSIILY